MYILRLTKIIPYILNVEDFERIIEIVSPPITESEKKFFSASMIIDDYENSKLIDVPRDLKRIEGEPLI